MQARRIATIVVPALLAGGCSVPANAPDGFRPLFSGRDLSGWTVKCRLRDAGANFFRVDQGTILADSIGRPDHDYIWLVTDREYSDFVLRLRFQAYRDSPGNSGIQVRSRYDDAEGWLDGPQIDINPPGPWRTGMIWDETRGSQRWLYPDLPRGKWVDESMAPPGLVFHYAGQPVAWNDLEVRADGSHIAATLNGIQVTRYAGAGVLDDLTHRGRQVGSRGVIALQIHRGDELRIRFADLQLRDDGNTQPQEAGSTP
jgi:hypothetical protein